MLTKIFVSFAVSLLMMSYIQTSVVQRHGWRELRRRPFVNTYWRELSKIQRSLLWPDCVCYNFGVANRSARHFETLCKNGPHPLSDMPEFATGESGCAMPCPPVPLLPISRCRVIFSHGSGDDRSKYRVGDLCPGASISCRALILLLAGAPISLSHRSHCFDGAA